MVGLLVVPPGLSLALSGLPFGSQLAVSGTPVRGCVLFSWEVACTWISLGSLAWWLRSFPALCVPGSVLTISGPSVLGSGVILLLLSRWTFLFVLVPKCWSLLSVLLNTMFGKAGGLGFGKNILHVAGMRWSPFLSLIKFFLLWISRTLVRGSCPVPSLPRSDWVPRSVRVLTLVFLRRLVLLLARGGAGALDSGSTSLGSVRTVLVLFLLNRLVLFLLDLVGPKKLPALMRSWRFDAGWLSAKTAFGTLRNPETKVLLCATSTMGWRTLQSFPPISVTISVFRCFQCFWQDPCALRLMVSIACLAAACQRGVGCLTQVSTPIASCRRSKPSRHETALTAPNRIAVVSQFCRFTVDSVDVWYVCYFVIERQLHRTTAEGCDACHKAAGTQGNAPVNLPFRTFSKLLPLEFLAISGLSPFIQFFILFMKLWPFFVRHVWRSEQLQFWLGPSKFMKFGAMGFIWFHDVSCRAKDIAYTNCTQRYAECGWKAFESFWIAKTHKL